MGMGTQPILDLAGIGTAVALGLLLVAFIVACIVMARPPRE
jgi:hypothetical protein